MEHVANFQRNDAGRFYAIMGAALVALGMVVGEIYAIYISHVLNGIIGQNWAGVIDAAGQGDLGQLQTHFSTIEELASKRGRTMHAHSHFGAFGLLALVLALLQPWVQLEPAVKLRLGACYLTGCLLHVSGLYVSFYTFPALAYLADLGTLLLIAVVATTLWGMRKYMKPVGDAGDFISRHMLEPASRYLVKSGTLLILIGMAFGLYYAFELVTVDEPAVYSSVYSAAASVEAGNITEAGEQIKQFKRMQSKIAITAAAHSHAIEFGFLMVLLAFVQRYVMFSEQWRLRWARTLSVGAFVLPVCVLLATKYGLRAAAFSDIFGSIALLGLSAMIVGMIRHTGATDFHEKDETS